MQTIKLRRHFTPTITAPHNPVRSLMPQVLEIAANPHKKKNPWKVSDIRKSAKVSEYFDEKRKERTLDGGSRKRWAVVKRTKLGFYVIGHGNLDDKGNHDKEIKDDAGNPIKSIDVLKIKLAGLKYTNFKMGAVKGDLFEAREIVAAQNKTL